MDNLNWLDHVSSVANWDKNWDLFSNLQIRVGLCGLYFPSGFFCSYSHEFNLICSDGMDLKLEI